MAGLRVMKNTVAFCEIMDIHECAIYLGISEDSLYKCAVARMVPAFKIGNRWRFKKSLVDEHIERMCREPNFGQAGRAKTS